MLVLREVRKLFVDTNAFGHVKNNYITGDPALQSVSEGSAGFDVPN